MKISELKVVFICPDHNELYHRRKLHTEELFTKLGVKEIIHYKSGTEQYPLCLRKAFIDVLTTYIDEPILLVEDDLAFTGNDEFEIVEGADAYYFCLSLHGGHLTENTHYGPSEFKPQSDTLVRVTNMLSLSSVLYLTRKYKEVVIESLSKDITQPLHSDILISRLLPHFNVFALKKPMFFQTPRVGGTDSTTNLTVNDDMSLGPPQKEVVLN
jgi:hypothetical protein